MIEDMDENNNQTTDNQTVSQMVQQEIISLEERIQQASLPSDLGEKLEREIQLLRRASQTNNYTEAYERTVKYVDWCLRVPWQSKSEDKLNLQQAQQIFDKHHYGMQEVKDRILEYLAILKLQQQKMQSYSSAKGGRSAMTEPIHAPQILLVGLVGTGKTTFAYAIAEALGREIIRIPFGGMGSARDLRGQSRLHVEAEPGLLIKGLTKAQTRNPVILLDEIDRVAEDARMDIMGVLVELLDPKQNNAFLDHYLDVPVDLSEAFMIATANNTRHIATAVMDRLERIDMPSYSDEEKIVIARDYILPRLLREAGMDNQTLVLADDIWPIVVRPLGYDAGLRTLERNLKGAVAKAARLRLEKNLPQVVINASNVKFFLPTY